MRIMRILLDSHIFIWLHEAPEQLSGSATRLLQDLDNELFLSMASVWEIQIKMSLGKLSLSGHIFDVVTMEQRVNNVQLLPIELRHISGLSRLPMHHRDPFDRLLLAQSIAEKMPILSADAVFDNYDAQVLR